MLYMAYYHAPYSALACALGGGGAKESFRPFQITGYQTAQGISMKGSKSKSPPQRKPNTTSQTKPTTGSQAKPTTGSQAKPTTGSQTKPKTRPRSKAAEGSKSKAEADGGKPRQPTGTTLLPDYSVNALSKETGKDRRTIDKAVAGLTPTRVVGKTKFYRLLDVETALKEKSGRSLRDEKLMEEIRKLRVANDLTEGKLVKKSQVQESLRRCLTPAVAILEQRLVNEYPTAVAGLDVPQARIYGKRLCDELMDFMQSLETEWNLDGKANVA